MDRHTPGPWSVEVGVASCGMLGRNGIYHAIKKGIHTYTVAHTEEHRADYTKQDIGGGYVRWTAVREHPPQRDPHPDVLLIAAAPDMLIALRQALGELSGATHQLVREAIAKAIGGAQPVEAAPEGGGEAV